MTETSGPRPEPHLTADPASATSEATTEGQVGQPTEGQVGQPTEGQVGQLTEGPTGQPTEAQTEQQIAEKAGEQTTTPAATNRRPARGRPVVVVGAVLGAGLALGAVLLPWVEQRYGTDLTARLVRKGYQAAPAVVPLALVAVAGLVAAFAGRGLIGRLIGVVLAGAGIALGIVGLAVLVNPPPNATDGTSGLPAPVELMGPVQVLWLGPVLVAGGGLLVLGSGLAVLTGAVGRQLGARFDAPATAASRPLSRDVADADAAAAWWKALDSGTDPTERMTDGPDRMKSVDRGNPTGHPTGDPDPPVQTHQFGQLP